MVVALLVIGLVGGDDDGDGEQAAEPTETQPRTERTEPEPEPPPPQRVVVRIAPGTPRPTCASTPGRTPRLASRARSSAPQTFRGRRLRVNFGNTAVEVTQERRAVPIEPSTEPVGFDFTPRGNRSLPLGERPCA